MHDSVLLWAADTIKAEDIYDRDVLEVGSFNVNGSLRRIVTACKPRSYLGVDRWMGPGVDCVVDAEELTTVLGRDRADVVISTEMLEHCGDWRRVCLEMVAALRPGGMLLLSTRSVGMIYHQPPDCWRYTWEALVSVFVEHAGLVLEEVQTDPELPGVFLLARKPVGWSGWADPDLSKVDGVTPMPQPGS